MSDMISRQTAISAICNACGKIDCDKMDKCEKLQLPPVNSSEFPNNSDTISRQAAIDALNEYFARIGKLKRRGLTKGEKAISLDTVGAIRSLPSAQPEIIHCKECKYGVQDEDKRWYCRGLGCQVGEADGSGFCADAERRTDD